MIDSKVKNKEKVIPNENVFVSGTGLVLLNSI